MSLCHVTEKPVLELWTQAVNPDEVKMKGDVLFLNYDELTYYVVSFDNY